jgi:hypothetical protein
MGSLEFHVPAGLFMQALKQDQKLDSALKDDGFDRSSHTSKRSVSSIGVPGRLPQCFYNRELGKGCRYLRFQDSKCIRSTDSRNLSSTEIF